MSEVSTEVSGQEILAQEAAAPAAPNNIGIGKVIVQSQLPMFICDLTMIADQLQLAKEAIYELRESHPQSPTSNVMANYMSPWHSHLLNPKLAPICASVVMLAKEISRTNMAANLEALNMDLVVTDCWGIIYENEDFTKVHNHFPAEFGCSIYLDADENCAPIIFEGNLKFDPKQNMMALFPGIMNHEVPKNTGKRTVLAMNLNKRALFGPAQ